MTAVDGSSDTGRVLLVLHEETLGGASRAVLRPAEHLRARGWDIHVWCARPSPLYDHVARLDYPVAGAPRLMRYRLRSLRHPPGVRARLASLPASLRAFRRHLRELRPDLVHVNGRLAIPEAVVARLCGFPVLVFMHDDALPGLRGLLARAAPWIGGHEVVSVSRSHARTLKLGGRVPRVVYAEIPIPDPLACRLKPAGAPVVVGTIGVVSPRKGTDLFIDMAERLRAARAPVELRIAGPIEEGPGRPWAQEQIRRGEAAGVRYLGSVDLARELREWDVMVLPSRADPFPLAVLETMAAGVAVVGARRDGIEEQLEGGAGVLVEPERADALTEAVLALVADPERRALLGAAGHARIRARFTTDRPAVALEEAWRATRSRA